MSNKFLIKYTVAFVLLALVLIFLGVNFVPRISASSSSVGNYAVSGNKTRINYIDEQYQRAIAPQLSNVVNGFRTPPMSNYVPSIAVEPGSGRLPCRTTSHPLQ